MKRIAGVVTAGVGWHANHMEQWSELPFDPFPGTLNVEVGSDVAERLRLFMPHELHWNNRRWPYIFGSLSGVRVAVTESRARPSEVEVLAAVRLRDLPLHNGDRITIFLHGL